MKHKHHIIPKHMGGTDDDTNLIYLTIEEHAEAHRILFEQYGHWQDRLAWQGLSKMISHEELIKQMLQEAGKKSHTVPRKSRKGMKLTVKANRSPKGTGGSKWYHDPVTMERGCYYDNEIPPAGWIRGQGKKKVNPGMNFHAKRKEESAVKSATMVA